VSEVNMKDFNFLPNLNIANVKKLFPKTDNNTCDLGACILYERSAYGSDKVWVSENKGANFKYPLIHSTTQKGPRIMYSKTNGNGFFGIPKVIFGESGINEPVIDFEGEYGMTQGAMALSIKNRSDGEKLVKFLKSNFFKNIRTACSWGGFRIDWRLFTYFKEDFWNVDVDLDEPLIILRKEDDEKAPSGGTRSNKHKPCSNKHYTHKTRKLRRR